MKENVAQISLLAAADSSNSKQASLSEEFKDSVANPVQVEHSQDSLVYSGEANL